jgi:REP element-mobilizing transposase RayT
MANTYTSLIYHVVFSTENREKWIKPSMEERVRAYLGGIAREHDMVAQQIGGIEDHVHLVLGMRASMGVSKAVQLLKGVSSKWVSEAFPALRGFAWQDGYGAFTVSKSQLATAIEYVARQREHHRARTFQEECRAMLALHEIEFDERYVWG